MPGAFTPGCSARHLPGYIQNLSALKSKGVDIVAVIAFNDAWVMSAWGKANGIKDDSIVCCFLYHYVFPRLAYSFLCSRETLFKEVLRLMFVLQQLFLSDPGTAFSKQLGWTMGERTARYAMVIDNGKITYAEKEPGREVTVSSAEAVLAKL